MIRELILPTTDRLVFIEAIVVAIAWISAAVLLRRQREWLLLVSGVAIMLFAWFALRAVH